MTCFAQGPHAVDFNHRMARTPRRSSEIDHTRLEILRAAARAFAACGFEDTTLTDIAKEAQYTVGSLYAYFSGKQQIIDSLLNVVVEGLVRPLGEKLPAGITFRHKVEIVVRRSLAFSDDWRPAVSVFLTPLLASMTPKRRVDPSSPRLEPSYLIGALEKWFREHALKGDLGGRTPLDVALFFMGVMQTLILGAVLRKSRTPLVNDTDDVVTLFFYGIGGRPT
jgi:AcrR family transcriptional regulator